MTNIDINQIRYLYYHEKKSVYEIAAIFGCSTALIYARMRKNGMQRRSKSEAQKLRCERNILNLDLAQIVRLYFEEYLSLADVGKRLGASSYTIHNRLTAAGYAPRKKSPHKTRISKFTVADRLEMKRLYCEEGQSLAQIAGQYDCADVTVMTHLKQQGVQLRTPKEARALRRKQARHRKRESAKNAKRAEGIPKEQVTPERILQLRKEENLLIDEIAAACSLSNVEVYNTLREAGGI